MRRTTLALLVLAPLALAPLTAAAADHCAFQAPRNLSADLTGVRTVVIDANSYDVHVNGSGGGHTLQVTGRACASDKALLDHLTVTQQREGDRLHLRVGGDEHWSFFGNGESDLEVTVAMPANLPLSVDTGSGDVDVGGVASLDAHVGSGDLKLHNIAGMVRLSVGSGDINATQIGSLDAASVGSGDLTVKGIRGDARIGSVGSGDVNLSHVGGSVHADTIGSGDLTVDDVAGDLHLGAKGSGDVEHHGVRGKVDVPRDDD